MPLIINYVPKHEDKVITMGKKDEPVADYYPPGATEPQVRPAHIPPPAVPEADVEEKSIREAATSPPVAKTVKKEPAAPRAARKK
jgi:hypothetical protein